MESENLLVYIFMGLIVFIVLFFIFREVALWYYKINKRLEVAEHTNYLLEQLLQHYGVKIEKKEISLKNKETGHIITMTKPEWTKHHAEHGNQFYDPVD